MFMACMSHNQSDVKLSEDIALTSLLGSTLMHVSCRSYSWSHYCSKAYEYSENVRKRINKPCGMRCSRNSHSAHLDQVRVDFHALAGLAGGHVDYRARQTYQTRRHIHNALTTAQRRKRALCRRAKGEQPWH